ncbi:MAG: hypothetical protein MUF72_19040 [Elainella sp. Prado103]|jgi:hypothetical protein|nr:hypothetical protein [Elainella sp. Prado103]
MTRFLLLGIIAIALFVIVPRVGATRSVKIAPNQATSAPNSTSSPLLARTIFDIEDVEGEDVIDRRDELREDGKLEERRDDARRWAEEND